MSKIVVRLVGNHPTGTRRRAGFIFTEAPIEVEVDKDQLKMIENDEYLSIVKKGNALIQAKENTKKLDEKKEDKKEDKKGTNIIEGKKEIIEKLKAKGLKEGEDFNSEASEEILSKLLNS